MAPGGVKRFHNIRAGSTPQEEAGAGFETRPGLLFSASA
jgi:hypothetical protein